MSPVRGAGGGMNSSAIMDGAAAAVPHHAPIGEDGVLVAIGPLDKNVPGFPTAHLLTYWTTFHLTPERIGPAGAGLWGANQVAGGPNLPVWSGFQGSELSWTGRLEPPLIYLPEGALHNPNRAAGWRADIDPVEPAAFGVYVGASVTPSRTILNTTGGMYIVGDRLYDRAGNVVASAPEGAIKPLDSHGNVRLTPAAPPQPQAVAAAYGYRVASPGAPGAAVVMQPGAQTAGVYVEPHTFAALLDQMRDAGEVFRLVVGDQYGFNAPVHLRSWEWWYEDPDPDVLRYSIQLEEHLISPLLAAHRAPRLRGGEHYNIRAGDSLLSIASKKLGKASDWRTLVALNRADLERYWIHAEPSSPIGYVYSRSRLSALDTRIHLIDTHGTGINPSATFLAGGQLLLKARTKHHHPARKRKK